MYDKHKFKFGLQDNFSVGEILSLLNSGSVCSLAFLLVMALIAIYGWW